MKTMDLHNTNTLSFKCTKKDFRLIGKIARRAHDLAAKHDFYYSYMTANMDINACHSNGNPLRLTELLEADDLNFLHDVFGIRRHINRETGKLENCFLPRFSKPV